MSIGKIERPDTSVWKSIWFLLKLHFFRTRNQMTQGKDKTGVLGYLGMVFLFFLCSWMIYEVAGKISTLPQLEQEKFSLVMHFFFVVFFFATEFSFKSKNAGATEKDTLWLMTLPIPMSTISLMKIAKIAVFNFTGSLLLLPTVVMATYLSIGGVAIVPAVVIIYLPFAFAVATLVHLTDMVLGLLFKPVVRKYLSFAFSILLFFSYFSLYQIYYSVDNEPMRNIILKNAEYIAFLDSIPLFKSALIPFIYAKDSSLGLSILFQYLIFCFSTMFVCAVIINGLSRRGFRERSGGKERGISVRSIRFSGVYGKELLLLYREKRLWFSLLLPVLMIMMNQFFQGFEIKTTEDVILQGFIVGLWVPISAIPVLSMKERECMWINFTFPESLSQQLFQKMFFWSAISALVSFLTIVFYLFIFEIPFGHLDKIILVPIFIFCISSVFYSLRVTNLDYRATLDTQDIKKSGVGTMYLLIGSAVFAIYAQNLVQSVGTVFLFCTLAKTLWQQNSSQFAHLLDDSYKPQMQIALYHGVIAVIGFAALQGLLFILLDDLQVENFSTLISFGMSGLIVYLLSAFYFWYNKAVNFARIFAFQAPKSWGYATRETIKLSILALVARTLYQPVADYAYVLSAETNPSVMEFTEVAFVAVVLAPIFEEIIFRGMVYGGIRKDNGVLGSVLFSSLLFTIIHPTISWPPVFALGVLCAYAYECTQSLLPSIVIHFVFNLTAMALSIRLISL